MKHAGEFELTNQKIRFYRLVNGSITIGWLCLVVYGVTKLWQ
jgi:hypothetical protein